MSHLYKFSPQYAIGLIVSGLLSVVLIILGDEMEIRKMKYISLCGGLILATLLMYYVGNVTIPRLFYFGGV